VLPQLIPDGDDVTAPDPVPVRVTLNANVEAVLNVAVTARAAVMETVHAPVPEHAPPQPANVEPLAAAAVRVTDVPLEKFALQADPQFTPDGFEVTVPAPVPAFVTLSAKLVVELLNVAVTDRAAVIETVQALVPLHAPLQPANVEPPAAAAMSVTDVPLAYGALQLPPQSMPPGDDVIVPLPAPAFETDNVNLLVPEGTKGERKLPPMTACGMPGPCQDTAK
jgi:hypothetical protein